MVMENPQFDMPTLSFEAGKHLKEVQKEYVLATLKACHGNRVSAAYLLGISYDALGNWLLKWNVPLIEGETCIRDRAPTPSPRRVV